MRVLLVDDHPAARAGMRSFLESTGEGLVVGEAGTVAEAIRQVEDRRPDVVVVDLVLPDGTAANLLEEMGSHGTGTAVVVVVVVVSAYPLAQMREQLAELGARGFYSKVDELEELLAGLREVSVGGEFASCNVDSVAEERRMRARLDREGLSDRQATVLMLLAQGYLAKEAADILGMSEHTLLVHKKRAMRKLRGRNIAEVASRLGLYW